MMPASYNCPDCGAPYKLGDKFCKECGLRLNDTPLGEVGTRRLPDQAQIPQGRRARVETPATGLRSPIPIGMLGGGLLLLVLLCGGLVALLASKGSVPVAMTPTPFLQALVTDTPLSPPTLVSATNTPVVVIVIVTATPAADNPLPTPVAPTNTALPVATTVTDTPPGTILDVGQTWRQGGLELAVTDSSLSPSGASFLPEITNRRSQTAIFRYTIGEVASAVNNQGQKLKVDVYTCYSDSLLAESQNVALSPGQTRYLIRAGCSESGYIFISADLTNPDINEIVITLSGLSSIVNARWRIPIAH